MPDLCNPVCILSHACVAIASGILLPRSPLPRPHGMGSFDVWVYDEEGRVFPENEDERERARRSSNVRRSKKMVEYNAALEARNVVCINL